MPTASPSGLPDLHHLTGKLEVVSLKYHCGTRADCCFQIQQAFMNWESRVYARNARGSLSGRCDGIGDG
jgi:hypothetical protein